MALPPAVRVRCGAGRVGGMTEARGPSKRKPGGVEGDVAQWCRMKAVARVYGRRDGGGYGQCSVPAQGYEATSQ